MQPTPVSLQPSKPPYFIIVSNEGHARIPHQHTTFADAEKEAFRLSTEHPGLTFTVFEAKLSLKTPTAPTERTTYEVQQSTVERRYYKGNPTWGVVADAKFFPFPTYQSAKEAEDRVRTSPSYWSGASISECFFIESDDHIPF